MMDRPLQIASNCSVAIRRVRRLIAALGICVTLAVIADQPANGSLSRYPSARVDQHTVRWHLWWASINDQPPPALQPYFPRFVSRYAAYASLEGKKPSFSAWLLAIGVVNPIEHGAMVLLHEWALRSRLIAE